jgi:hypothetical protein
MTLGGGWNELVFIAMPLYWRIAGTVRYDTSCTPPCPCTLLELHDIHDLHVQICRHRLVDVRNVLLSRDRDLPPLDLLYLAQAHSGASSKRQWASPDA